MAKMNKKIKALWLAALRSGVYAQGRGKLHNMVGNTYCCLGVLQAVAGGEKCEDGDEYLKPGTHGLTQHHQEHLGNLNDASYDFQPTIRYISRNL
jgi:hypothetical protein